jgi:hypothetical protein
MIDSRKVNPNSERVSIRGPRVASESMQLLGIYETSRISVYPDNRDAIDSASGLARDVGKSTLIATDIESPSSAINTMESSG